MGRSRFIGDVCVCEYDPTLCNPLLPILIAVFTQFLSKFFGQAHSWVIVLCMLFVVVGF